MRGIDVPGQPVTLVVATGASFVGTVEESDERGILITVAKGSCFQWTGSYFFPWAAVRYVQFDSE